MDSLAIRYEYELTAESHSPQIVNLRKQS